MCVCVGEREKNKKERESEQSLPEMTTQSLEFVVEMRILEDVKIESHRKICKHTFFYET